MTSTALLETPSAGAVWAAIILILIGLLALRQGWAAYTDPTPTFVLHYAGWSCPPLAMFYGGTAMLIMGTFGPLAEMEELEAAIPKVVSGGIGLIWIFCGITFLLGFFFWFPPFLVPRWYWRARRAGIPRNDPQAMGEFKALPVEKQKAAARRGRRR